MSVTIYHNSRCRKSRETLEIIKDAGHEIQIVEYLKTPPGGAELDKILTKLNMQPQDLMRKGEAIYKELDLKNSDLSRAEYLNIMSESPILIERPIVLTDKGARIGRPPEIVKEIL